MSDFPNRLDRDPRVQPPRGPRRPGAAVITAGLAVALVLGIAGGFAMKPRLNDQALGKKVENHRVVEIPKEPSGLGIVVDRTVTAITQPAPLPVTPAPPDESDPAVAAQPKDSAPTLEAPSPVVVGSIPERTPPTPSGPRPSFNCAYARSGAERMICGDAQLASLDRQMSRAYRRALDAGVPRRILDRQQAVWMSARERAARDGPEAVADVYGQRIAELEGLARY
jgi:hypothetical protein